MQKQLSSFLLQKNPVHTSKIHCDLVKNIALNPQQSEEKKSHSLFTFAGESFASLNQ